MGATDHMIVDAFDLVSTDAHMITDDHLIMDAFDPWSHDHGCPVFDTNFPANLPSGQLCL